MRFFSYLRVEFARMLHSRFVWLVLLAAALCPLAGYTIYQPAGTGTTATIVLANPMLSGALGGAFLFAALTLYELNRVKKGQMEPITDSITSPMLLGVVRTVSLLLVALLSSVLTFAVHLPYTWFRLGEAFQIHEYIKFSAIFLLPMLLMAVLLSSALYQILRRVDLGFFCFTATMLAGLSPWNTDTYLLYWINISELGFSGDMGNTAIYRMALYSRMIWLLLFGGFWVFSLLCTRNHGKNLPSSFLQNSRKVYLPILTVALVAGGAWLYVKQPYMDHEEPLVLDASGVTTGGGFTVSMDAGTEERQDFLLQNTEMELQFDTRQGILYENVRYQMENTSGQPLNCLLQVGSGCTIESIHVNGIPLPYTDLHNDYFIVTKDVSLTLPKERDLDVVIRYQCRPQIPANSGTLALYYEITPEYISMGGTHVVPVFQSATEADDCTFSGTVTLPTGMELIAVGEPAKIIHENSNGTTVWGIKGAGSQVSIFAGNYIRAQIPNTEFWVYFCYSKNHQQEFEQMDIEKLLTDTISYCAEQYGPLPYTQDEPLNIVMTSAHLMGGGAKANLSYMGETFFSAANLNDPVKGGSAAEVIAHEIIHQWWGVQCMVMDMENTDWSAEALTCYTTYRLMKDLNGEEYAKKFYVDVWQNKYDNMMNNFYLRNPEYLMMLPEQHQVTLSNMIFDACTYAKAPLQILKAEQLIGGEEKMDEILQGLFVNGGTEMPPFITWQDFLDACGLTEDQLSLEGGENHA